jgi:hypothetical protein
MKHWLGLIMMNAGAIVGAVLAALYLIPESTPVWLWAVATVAVLIALNIKAVIRIRRQNARNKFTPR